MSLKRNNPGRSGWPARLRSRLGLTLKMTMLTALVGTAGWGILDYIQTISLKNIFQTQLMERLSQQARQDRIQFNHYLASFRQAAKVYAASKSLEKLTSAPNWQSGAPGELTYHRTPPDWLPDPSIMRTFPLPRFILLIDGRRRLREVYLSRNDILPPFLLKPSVILLEMSHGQNLMTTREGFPYSITSDSLFGPQGETLATILLASPIDDEFLVASFGPVRTIYKRALLTSDQRHILVSTDPHELPAGSSLEELAGRYLVTGKEFFDYGSSDLEITLASFTPVTEVEALTTTIISEARRQHTLLAVVIIVSCGLVMSWVTRHIKRLTARVMDFEQKELGGTMPAASRGDELEFLHTRFQTLFRDVVDSREFLRQQAREKTRIIINHAWSAIISVTGSGRILSWNPSAERIFGFSSREAVDRNIDEIVKPAAGKALLPTIRQLVHGREAPSSDHPHDQELLHRDGHRFIVELSATTAETEEGRIFILFFRDITQRRQAELERERLIGKLQDALTEIKTLKGILPICASCKKIRDDQGYWNQIEAYVSDHSEAEFSHSICPDCARRLYPEYNTPME